MSVATAGALRDGVVALVDPLLEPAAQECRPRAELLPVRQLGLI